MFGVAEGTPTTSDRDEYSMASTASVGTNSVVSLGHRLRSGDITSEQLRDMYRDRIRAIDPEIHAFVSVANEEEVRGHSGNGKAIGAHPLAGIPFAVKDVIDVAGIPSRAGSRSRFAASAAPTDADVVASLRRAGLIPFGKTATTEFAFIDPAPTRNPHNPAHSPGGSSSGSGAAVAAGMIPFALGTQTAGSLCRPAAYCGIAAIKPSHGNLSTRGLVPLAQTFDSIGVIARRVADAAEVLGVLGQQTSAETDKTGHRRLAVLNERFYRNSSPEVCDFHEDVVRTAIRSGASVSTIDLEADFNAVAADHRLVMLHEAFQNHGHLLAEEEHGLGPRIEAALREGSTISPSVRQGALKRLQAAQAGIWKELEGVEGLILQPVPTSAPEGLATTGDQSYLTPWTVFGGPLVIVPGRYDSKGLPLAAMVATSPGRDSLAADIGCWLEEQIDRLPDHVTPGAR